MECSILLSGQIYHGAPIRLLMNTVAALLAKDGACYLCSKDRGSDAMAELTDRAKSLGFQLTRVDLRPIALKTMEVEAASSLAEADDATDVFHGSSLLRICWRT